MPEEVVEWLENLKGYSLNIGAGATRRKIAKSIEMEYSIFKNTDIAGDAHHLPFKNNVFDAVVAFNVFEHLHSPAIAAAEIFRVLKPGGKVMIHTAFLQPLHEEPFHFYNATEHGVIQWFSRFDIELCQVSNNFSPALTLAWLAHDLLYFVESLSEPKEAQALANTTLAQWRQLWTDENKRRGLLWDVIAKLPQSTQKRFSAGFELKAIKPVKLLQDIQNYAVEDNDVQSDQSEKTDLIINQLIQELAFQKEQTENYREKYESLYKSNQKITNLPSFSKEKLKTLFRLLKKRLTRGIGK
ncbi:class I SAM-dependent methyltransferase [Coleofasciculus sp. FACHB-501]|uniref:class I SAM-dependent methyltransferase n=1 Tax=Cyanophyceae TaxID=3028117 RepID=UPI00168214EA|nr:class I SAM-dependent methyltransferase [Coleofasciculus sp. FACHB-501]MBD1837183.1 class I SAM-dependent methyltransferase [Coleofasciculus sp. FACHB-501]